MVTGLGAMVCWILYKLSGWPFWKNACVNQTACACISKAGFRTQFLKAVAEQLPNETGKLGIIEVFWKNLLFQGLHIPNGETTCSGG
jgi:hypothetical protein